MSDPTNPADPKKQAADDTTELAPVPAVDAPATDPAKDAGATAVAAKDASADSGEPPKKKGLGRFRLRGPWVTVGSAVVVLIVLAVLGYLWGLGPLSRLNAERAITPPAKVAGLDRITDPEIRSQAQLDQTRDALSRINDGKKVMVEAYGSLEGDRFYVLIALRGRVDIDKVVADSGATADKIKKIGHSTCIEAAGNLPTQCYRGSNTLTVIAQSANEGVAVDQVEPIAEEAFKAMR
ncbi:hypothetical protein [Kribbella speibonae]|uniref:hypothetical protein n=1 Tax=Kribbella speibonae TaxID=1572660 RepID=UPI001EE0A6DD|nr:hypothetical protein [Kribbella speibonae]